MAPYCPAPVSFIEIVDYWADGLSAEAADRIEEHVFVCDSCARQFAHAEALARGIVAVVRQGRFHESGHSIE
jgi:hypothetical protein